MRGSYAVNIKNHIDRAAALYAGGNEDHALRIMRGTFPQMPADVVEDILTGRSQVEYIEKGIRVIAHC